MRDVTIRKWRDDDIKALHAIDFAAAQLIARHGFPAIGQEPVPLAAFETMLRQGDVNVAALDGVAVGFSVAHDLDGVYWLRELSVDPAHGRQGVGTALVKAVIDRAKWAFYNAVGLSTFKDVPFNRPFYEKRGFTEVDLTKAPPALQVQFAAEIPCDTLPTTRVLMVKML